MPYYKGELTMTNRTQQVARQVMLPGQAAAPAGAVDLVAMYLMHYAFRRDLADFRSAVGRTPPGDRAAWVALDQRWRRFAGILHKHHVAEDTGLWPLLKQRASQVGDAEGLATLADMEEEHASIDPLLTECQEEFAMLAQAFHARSRDRLGEMLVTAAASLDRHLAHEERDAMSLVQRHLQPADWARVERKHFRPAYALKETPFMIAWVLSGLSDGDRARVRDAFGGRALEFVWRLLLRGPFERKEEAAFRHVPERSTMR